MADDEGTGLLEGLLRVHAALGGLSARDRLDVITFAWLTVALNARAEALIVPGGFPEERDRQIVRLRKMADHVGTDDADLEMERVYQEGDFEGILRRVRAFRAGLDQKNEGSAGDPEKGGA